MADLYAGFYEFEKEMDEFKKALATPQCNWEMLEAMSQPIIREAKDIARRMSDGKYTLRDGIVLKWSHSNPLELKIGWTKDAFYGPMLENGYHHVGTQRFIKLPHLRPATNSKLDEGVKSAQNVLYAWFSQ